MTGGVLFLHDADTSVKAHISDSAPAPRRLGSDDAAELKTMIEAHVARTGSTRGTEILSEWETAVSSFWVLRPEPQSAIRVPPSDVVTQAAGGER